MSSSLSVSSRVVVAMSGGVDSSVAAALLVRAGYDVIGVTYKSYTPPDADPFAPHRFGGCCTVGDAEDARRVADRLGIPHYVLNMSPDFERTVIKDFIDEYQRGRTPNPCVRCNQYIKFSALWRRAAELGADFVATGHYARIHRDAATNKHGLWKGLDPRKDQTYVLYVMNQAQLAHSLFPLGTFTKERTRELARELGLVTANKPDSQEICFIEDNDYPRFIAERRPDAVAAGPIVNTAGEMVGEHRGVAFYTIGQRKGLGLTAREPHYVIDIDAEQNQIRVGSRDELYAAGLTASPVHWIAGEPPASPIEVTAKIRYNAAEVPATLAAATPDELRLTFAAPQPAITPGQAVVVYAGEKVVGGGTIGMPVPV